MDGGKFNLPVDWRRLRLIFLLAVLLRVLASLVFVDVIGDRTEAVEIARALALHRGFSDPIRDVPTGPTALVPPVLPFLRGMAYRVLGLDSRAALAAVLLFNSLCSAAVCITLFFLGSRWFGVALGMRAAWAWAVFPYAIALCMPRSGEAALASFLVSLAFLLTLHLAQSTRVLHWFSFGLLGGFLALAHTSALSIVALLLGWLLWKSQGLLVQRACRVALASVAVLLVITPWMARNYIVFHQFVFLRSGFGLELHVGNSGNTAEYRDLTVHPTRNQLELQRLVQLGEIAYMAEKKAKALRIIHGHPAEFLIQTLRHAGCFWTGAWDLRLRTLLADPYYAASIVFCGLMALLALAGLVALAKTGQPGWGLLAAIFLVYPLVYYITHANERFRHPIEPFMILLLCVVLPWLPGRPLER